MKKYLDVMGIQDEKERLEKLKIKYRLLERAEYIKMYAELMTYKGNSEEQIKEYYYKLKSLL
jgi:hypothetical protein